MKKFARRWWWAGFGRRRGVRRAREVDPADMGTAFGLDASVEPYEAARPTPDPVGAAPVPSWDARLVRRTGL